MSLCTHINQAGLDLIKRFEGLKLRAYRCSAGVLTIGYGSTIDVHEGQVITQAQADDLLRADLHDAEAAVTKLIAVPLNDNEFSALVSFTYNLGSGAPRASSANG